MGLNIARALNRIFQPQTASEGDANIVIKRGRKKFTITPDEYEDFPFESDDKLDLLFPNEALARTPDGHVHVQRSDGGSIRIPSTMIYARYRGYKIPEHLVVLTGAGSSTLEPIGKGHVTNYMKFMGIDPSASFLEIGSGIGRDALQLIDVLGASATYIGIDVTRDSIEWCQKNITRTHPNFQFHHFDAKHELYNPLGTKTSLDFRLPAADNSIDRIALGSVFTHLFKDEIVHYMREIARVLKPDGIAYATFFLYSKETIASARKKDITSFNLRFEHPYGEGCYINDAAYPTGAVAFTDEAMRRMIEQGGLHLKGPYLKGWWSGLHETSDDGQEVALLGKGTSPP